MLIFVAMSPHVSPVEGIFLIWDANTCIKYQYNIHDFKLILLGWLPSYRARTWGRHWKGASWTRLAITNCLSVISRDRKKQSSLLSTSISMFSQTTCPSFPLANLFYRFSDVVHEKVACVGCSLSYSSSAALIISLGRDRRWIRTIGRRIGQGGFRGRTIP